MNHDGYYPTPPHPYSHQHWPEQVRYDWNNNPPFYNHYRRINIIEAMNIALERVPGEVVKIELEREQGILFYEVDILTAQGRKYEVGVNIESGHIMYVQPD